MDAPVTFDDLLNPDAVPPRQTQGRSSEEATMARRLRVLELFGYGLTAQIYQYVEGLGFSRKTAENDISWAKQEWKAQHNSSETPLDVIQRHKAKYAEYAWRSEQAGDLKQAKEMMQANEKLSGFHDPEYVRQLVAEQQVERLDYSRFTDEQFAQFEELLKIATINPSAE